ncbi:hypothetical protein ACEQPO_19005 [Bacillus sp. SL00103]
MLKRHERQLEHANWPFSDEYTLHAKNAKGALYRMLEFGVTMNELEQTMVAIAARLIELTCPFCGEICQLYCKLNRPVRRTNVFELLFGKSLVSVSRRRKRICSPSYETLQRLIRKKSGTWLFIEKYLSSLGL